MRSELPLRTFEKDPLVTGPVLDLGVVGLDLFAMLLRQLRPRIKRVDVRNPAVMNRKMTFLAFAGKCGSRGASGSPRPPRAAA